MKKILAVMLTICLLICSMAVPAGADTTENLTMTVDPVYVTGLKVGDSIEVPVSLSKAEYGYGSVGFSVKFPTDKLEYSKTISGPASKKATWLDNCKDGVVQIGWLCPYKNCGYDGTLLTMVFTVKDTNLLSKKLDFTITDDGVYEDDSNSGSTTSKDITVVNRGFRESSNLMIDPVNSDTETVGDTISVPFVLSKVTYGYASLQISVVCDPDIFEIVKIDTSNSELIGSLAKNIDNNKAVVGFMTPVRYQTGGKMFDLVVKVKSTDYMTAVIDDISFLANTYIDDSFAGNEKTKAEANNITFKSASAESVIEKINGIGDVTIESGSLIASARTKYNTLDDIRKKLVGNYTTLQQKESAYAGLVTEKINDIGEVSLYSGVKISEARKAYDALLPEQQYLVKNYSVITSAEARYAELLADKRAADKVTEMINAIGTVSKDSEKQISEVRKAYDSLTDTQKNMVSNYQTLLQAEAQLEVIKSDKSAVDLVIGKILAIGKVTLESEDVITAARAAYDALTNEQKLSVTNYNVLLTAEATLQTIKQDADPGLRVVEKINQIGEVTPESGQLIQQARNAYDQLTTTQKSYVNNYDVLVAAETEFAQLMAYQDAIEDTINKINAIGEVTYQSGDAISAARSAFDALDYAQKAKIYNLETLLVAEIKYRDIKANYDAAVPVIEAIAPIENMNIDLDSGDMISSVRAKYDALSEEQKAYVSNYSVLTDAEAYFNAIYDVYTKIRDIGKVTLEKISAVEQAREAYDALTTEQKDKITNYTVLVVSENSVLVLTCDKNKAEQVSEKIDEIENLPEADEQKPEISDENYEDIKARLDALEKLIDELIKKFATVEKDGKETVDEQKAEIVKETFYSEKVEKLKQAVEVYESVAVNYGDVDGDGVVTVKDALMTLQAYVKTLELTDSQKIAADVDGESGVSIKDALLILQYFVGIVTKFPVEM